MKPVSSFLAWPGGKARLLDILLPLFPSKIRRYYEPFLGGGAVALNIAERCKDITLSDVNPCVINAWQSVRDCPTELYALISNHKDQLDRNGRGYFDHQKREYNRARGTGIAAAARFIFLNKSCFNGSWRCNKEGNINITYGERCYLPPIVAVSSLIQNAAISDCGYESILSGSFSRSDVVYLDPPYYSDRPIASGYGIGKFTEAHRTNMIDMAKQSGAIVIGSDLDTPYTRNLYESAGFTVESHDHIYTIGGHQKSRSTISELMYHNM